LNEQDDDDYDEDEEELLDEEEYGIVPVSAQQRVFPLTLMIIFCIQSSSG
jgi:hypothetical protein